MDPQDEESRCYSLYGTSHFPSDHFLPPHHCAAWPSGSWASTSFRSAQAPRMPTSTSGLQGERRSTSAHVQTAVSAVVCSEEHFLTVGHVSQRINARVKSRTRWVPSGRTQWPTAGTHSTEDLRIDFPTFSVSNSPVSHSYPWLTSLMNYLHAGPCLGLCFRGKIRLKRYP